MPVYRVGPLPEEPMAAAAAFYGEHGARVLPALQAARGDAPGRAQDIVIIFAPADHTHRGWRLAAVQALARAAAPLRVNAVESDDEAAIAAARAYLAGAPGLTGQVLPLAQVLPLDSQGAGVVLG